MLPSEKPGAKKGEKKEIRREEPLVNCRYVEIFIRVQGASLSTDEGTC